MILHVKVHLCTYETTFIFHYLLNFSDSPLFFSCCSSSSTFWSITALRCSRVARWQTAVAGPRL
jgi:hypothetical protein